MYKKRKMSHSYKYILILFLLLILSSCSEKDYKVNFIVENQIYKIMNYSEIIDLPVPPTKDGYDFDGWYYNGLPYKKNIKPNENINIYAKYSKIKYTVKFLNWDDTVLSIQYVEKYDSAIAPNSPFREGYNFIDWDNVFNKIVEDIVVKPIFDICKYKVVFKDYFGQVLSEQYVNYNDSAKPPVIPNYTGYQFIEWDKEYNNVITDMEINPLFIKDAVFSIDYSFNGGYWNYPNKEESINEFLTDFYMFVKPDCSLNDFINGDKKFDGKWKNYVGGYFRGINHLLYNNDFSIKNNEYFLNSDLYHDKWIGLALIVNQMNKRLGSKGNTTTYLGGVADLYRYIINDAQGNEKIYGSKFNEIVSFTEGPKFYNLLGGQVELIVPLRNGYHFLGWYDNENFKGEAITKIEANSNKNYILYAKWEEICTYELLFYDKYGSRIENITVLNNQTVSLPSLNGNYEFLGWRFNDQIYNTELSFNFNDTITLTAVWNDNKEYIKYNDSLIPMGTTNKPIEINSFYMQRSTEFRGIWVTKEDYEYNASDNKYQMMSKLTKLLDDIQLFNFNAVIFSLDYLSNISCISDYSPISSIGKVDRFEGGWNYLSWFIEECHKRNIEFHAWVNPFRFGYSYKSTSPENIKNLITTHYKDYPYLPLSNKDNIIIDYKSDGSLIPMLNPAKPEVRDYVISAYINLAKQYNIDAIHMDDSFTGKYSVDNNYIYEPDQIDYISYINKNPERGFRNDSKEDKLIWRRELIDKFIEELNNQFENFNDTYNRFVQIGVSPTPVYLSGDGNVIYDNNGNAITTGSATTNLGHYLSGILCDTKKWIDNQWIDYIIPQLYFSLDDYDSNFAALTDWWAKVVANKNVNLYLGIGIYFSADNYTNVGKSWATEPYELCNQLMFMNKYESVKGFSIFRYKYLKMVYNDKESNSYPGIIRAMEVFWKNPISTPNTMADR